MPTYEYICTECQQKTEVLASISEKERGLKPTCPKCGSKEMAQVFGSFMVMGSSSSKNNPLMCGPAAGPGCCG